MKQDHRLTIVHLSDLHFTADALERDDVKSWYDSLLSDILQCLKHRPRSETFVVISGDITVSGQPAEFANAERFFDRLISSLHLRKDHLLLVPGNHDLSWNRPIQYERDAFFECARRFAPEKEDPHAPLRRFHEQGVVFFMPSMAKVSSANEACVQWGAAQDKLERAPWENDLHITVTHDPAHSEVGVNRTAWDDPRLNALIFHSPFAHNGPHIILHGQTHREGASTLRSDLKKTIYSVAAGPLSCEKWRRTSTGFPLYHLLMVCGHDIAIRTRVYLSQSGRWIDRDRTLSDLTPDHDRALSRAQLPAVKRAQCVELVDRLCELSEYDVRLLLKDLGTAIETYVPMRESREEFAFRLVAYFAKEDSLEHLNRSISKLSEIGGAWSIRVFVAATKQGRKVARAMAALCKSLGAEPWIAEQNLAPKFNAEVEIMRAINRADIFLVIVAGDFKESRWIGREIGIALKAAGSGRPRVVPVLLRGAVLPDLLKGLHTIEIEDEDKITVDVLADVLRSS